MAFPVGTWLGGVQLVNPDYAQSGVVLTAVDVGAMQEMLDGSLAYDYVGDRAHWALHWNNITYAQLVAIVTRYQVKSAQVFSPPDEDATSYTVLVIPNTWKSTYIEAGDGTKLYSCDMELEETGV